MKEKTKIVWNKLRPPTWTQIKVLKEIIEPALFDGISITRKSRLLISDNDRTARSRFFNGNPAGKVRFESYIEFILISKINPNTNKENYENFKFRKTFKQQWRNVFITLTAENKDQFKENIENLYKNLKKESVPFLSNIPDAIKNLDFIEQLTILSLIASTWYAWERYEEDKKWQNIVEHLAILFFPNPIIVFPDLLQEGQGKVASGVDISDKQREQDNRKAHGFLSEANRYLKSGEYQKAGALYEATIECYFAADFMRGEAFFKLGCCCEPEGAYPVPAPYSSVDDLFQKALALGYQESNNGDNQKIMQLPVRAISSYEGLCIINVDSKSSAIKSWIEQTVPSSWELKISKNPEMLLEAGKHQRIVLVREDFKVNMKDALRILSAIQKSSLPLNAWENTEIYVRGEEEKFTSILDTTLNLLAPGLQDSCPVRIFLIDEAKRAAQLLYARHPLFYHLTALENRGSRDTLRLVILSNNSENSLVNWLVREAFWLLPMPNLSIKTKITVLSPNAAEVGYQLCSQCPGLYNFCSINSEKNSDKHNFNVDMKDIPFPFVEFITVASFESPALANELYKIEHAKNFLYYVIDTGDDLDNIELAVRVREETIRHAVHTNRVANFSTTRPVVALHCTDPDYAQLARQLLVPKEQEHGNQWFNNYGFVTFGSLDELYSWNELNGGAVETVAECIHLQYSQVDPASDPQKELTSYFKRLYNRDSSFAGAISLPYRLFQAGIYPTAWYIQNPKAYWSEEQRRVLAEKFEGKLHIKDERTGENVYNQKMILQLAQYEHIRWCCYMLSRGWSPVTGDSVAQYMKAGAQKHALQIARLHPCICSWQGLIELQNTLDFYYRGCSPDYDQNVNFDQRFEKYQKIDGECTYFTTIDVNNIKMTPDLLKATWFIQTKELDNEHC